MGVAHIKELNSHMLYYGLLYMKAKPLVARDPHAARIQHALECIQTNIQ